MRYPWSGEVKNNLILKGNGRLIRVSKTKLDLYVVDFKTKFWLFNRSEIYRWH